MGMFSWKCKGCGGELIRDEIVRIAGFKGTYDGYGRVDGTDGGSFDTEGIDLPAWHEKCYQEATPEQQVDESPSEHAPNQGFGYPRYEFLPEYEADHYILKASALVDRSEEMTDDTDRSPEWLEYNKLYPKYETEHCYKGGKFNPVFMENRPEHTHVLTLGEAEKIAEYHLSDFSTIDIIAIGEGDGIIKTYTNEEKKAEMEKYTKTSNKAFQAFMDKRHKREN